MRGLSDLFYYLGIAMMLVGWIWTIVSAFRMGGVGYGVANIIPLQPLIGIVCFLIKKVPPKPVLIMLGGVVAYYIGGMISR